jgi:CDP-alcohol phosphatidyltransferase-like enzyme
MINVPNLLSIFRILLVPPLVVVLLTKFEGKEFVGLALFLLAAVMDFFDGFLARRRQQVTRLGTLLDPAADKILVSAAYISLVELDPTVVPAWMVVVIIAREFAVTSLRSCAPPRTWSSPRASRGSSRPSSRSSPSPSSSSTTSSASSATSPRSPSGWRSPSPSTRASSTSSASAASSCTASGPPPCRSRRRRPSRRPLPRPSTPPPSRRGPERCRPALSSAWPC